MGVARTKDKALPASAGEYLRRLRTDAELSIDQLAFRARISARQIGAYERGENEPGINTWARLMRALGEPVPWTDDDSGDSSTARYASPADWGVLIGPEDVALEPVAL